MTDEKQTPQEQGIAGTTGEDTTEYDLQAAANEVLEASVGGETDAAQYADGGEADKLPEPATPLEAAVTEAVAQSEAAADNPAVRAWDEAVQTTLDEAAQIADGGAISMTADHAHSDTVVLPYLGAITVPGGIYTVVFGILGLLTVAEVLVAEIFADGFLKLIFLVVASLSKAVLVVMFYMHLATDNRIFRVVLLVPLLVVIISILYLVAVPPGAGLGYS